MIRFSNGSILPKATSDEIVLSLSDMDPVKKIDVHVVQIHEFRFHQRSEEISVLPVDR